MVWALVWHPPSWATDPRTGGAPTPVLARPAASFPSLSPLIKYLNSQTLPPSSPNPPNSPGCPLAPSPYVAFFAQSHFGSPIRFYVIMKKIREGRAYGNPKAAVGRAYGNSKAGKGRAYGNPCAAAKDGISFFKL